MCVRVRYYNYAEPLLQWPGRLAMGVVCSSTSRSKWCRIACIHWNFTHGLCVVQFSKSLHVLQTTEYMTWKTPTHIYEACNQHNSSCCRMEPPWQLRLDLAVAGKQVPMRNNGRQFLINGYFVTDRTLHMSSVNLTENNGEKKMRAGFCGR